MPKTTYYHDDARIQAVKETLDPLKTWGKQGKEAQLRAVQRWHEIIYVWYAEHKEYADSPAGIERHLDELKHAFMHYRKVQNKSQ